MNMKLKSKAQKQLDSLKVSTRICAYKGRLTLELMPPNHLELRRMFTIATPSPYSHSLAVVDKWHLNFKTDDLV